MKVDGEGVLFHVSPADREMFAPYTISKTIHAWMNARCVENQPRTGIIPPTVSATPNTSVASTAGYVASVVKSRVLEATNSGATHAWLVTHSGDTRAFFRVNTPYTMHGSME